MSNLNGIFLMVAANALFALSDALIKVNSTALTSGHIIGCFSLSGLAIYALAAWWRRDRLWTRAVFAPVVVGRNIAEVVGSFGMITALALAPLTMVAAILQMAPLIVTLLAALILKEAVGWRRWTAILLGFAGMLLIIRPGADGFDPALIFAVVGMIGLSFRDLFTRLSPPDLPSTTLAFYGVLSLAPLSLVLIAGTGAPGVPTGVNWWLVLTMASFGSVGYLAITLALRAGEVSVIAPFRYSRLIFAMVLAVIFFGERPDGATLAGAGLILGAGLYSWWRERTRHAALHSGASPR